MQTSKRLGTPVFRSFFTLHLFSLLPTWCFYSLSSLRPSPYRTFLHAENVNSSLQTTLSITFSSCLKYWDFFCRPHTCTRHAVRLHRFPLDLHRDYQLTRSLPKDRMAILVCHASARHENSIHQVVLFFGQLLHPQRRLPVARIKFSSSR